MLYIYAFASVIIVSLVSLVGVFTISLKEELLRKYIFVFISLAVGALLGDAFIHLIPEAFENSPNPIFVSLLIIAGILIFFLVEKFLHWHHHGEAEDQKSHIHPVGKLVILGDGIHNVIDGIIIGASFMISIPVGIATTIAVILHEIPQEIGDFGVLLNAGYTKSKALWLNFFSGLSAILGLLFTIMLGSWAENSILWLLPIAAGGFIYIAVADLIPELHKTKNTGQAIIQIVAIFIGILAMVALTLLES